MLFSSIPLLGYVRSSSVGLLFAGLPGSAVETSGPLSLALVVLSSALTAFALWLLWSALRRTF